MTAEPRRLNPDEAATATRMDIGIVWHYAELGLIAPSSDGYTDADLAELRRVRRLWEDLGLDHPAIEVVLRMSRRILALQAEVRRLKSAASAGRGQRRQRGWVEAEWDELF
jgi:DNA-binding transcriptional MerR regulator